MTKPEIMNCIIVDSCEESRKLLEGFVSKSPFLNLIGTFSDFAVAKKTISKHNDVDLIILDLQNPEGEGFDFIRGLDIQLNVIIISSSERYALQAFDFNVVDYLLMPFSYLRFCKAIDRANNKFELKKAINRAHDEVFIKTGSTLVKLRLSDIIYVEALENYVTLYSKNDRFTIHFTMKAMENQLPSEIFKRVHKSLIINKNNIQTINDDSLSLNVRGCLKSFPLGKSFKHSLLSHINVMAS